MSSVCRSSLTYSDGLNNNAKGRESSGSRGIATYTVGTPRIIQISSATRCGSVADKAKCSIVIAFFIDGVVNQVFDTNSTYDIRDSGAGLQLCAIYRVARVRKVPSSAHSNMRINAVTSPEIYTSGIVFGTFRSVSIRRALDRQRLVPVCTGIWFNRCGKGTWGCNGYSHG